MPEIRITGKGNQSEVKTKALLSRSNLGGMLNAIRYVTEHPDAGPIYFEGNIASYTYATEGASLYDVLQLADAFLSEDTLLELKDGEENR